MNFFIIFSFFFKKVGSSTVYAKTRSKIERTERQKAARRLCEAACNLLYDKNPNWYYVVVDSYILEMSSAQIGKVLGLTTGNVDVIKYRAREYLRKKLGKELKEFL